MVDTIDTKEKFNEHRLQLAKNVWRAMKTTDSRECRNCHEGHSMDFQKQEERASKRHEEALAAGSTCIDCHQGIAHKQPAGAQKAYKEMLDSIDNVGPVQKLVDFLQGADVAKAKAAPR